MKLADFVFKGVVDDNQFYIFLFLVTIQKLFDELALVINEDGPELCLRAQVSDLLLKQVQDVLVLGAQHYCCIFTRHIHSLADREARLLHCLNDRFHRSLILILVVRRLDVQPLNQGNFAQVHH